MANRSSLKNVIRLIGDAQENLPVEQNFLSDLKRSIEIDNTSDRKPSKTYKPSSMNCVRNMAYQILGAEVDNTKPSYISVGIVNSGSDIHTRMQIAITGMKENGMDCDYVPVDEFIEHRHIKDVNVVGVSGMETKLYHKTLNMSFMCDGIIKYKNHYYILELKTETSNKFFNRSGVDSKHYNQATAYSLALGLDEVIFVYISRDTLDMKSYLFNVTGEMKQELVGRIEYCDGYVKQGLVPPKPENIDRKTCQYCNYQKQCKRNV